MEYILLEEKNEIATVTLNRVDKRNAVHGPMIAELIQALKKCEDGPCKVLMIKGNGEHLCAGGDIAWMQKMVTVSSDENHSDAQALSSLLYHLYCFSKPTIVLAHGSIMGGGLGLLAAADIAVATKSAIFGLPEVKIGLTPSIISPYVVAAMGERAAYYHFLTGARFNADEALRIGLIHRVVEEKDLLNVGMEIAATLIENSPQALFEAKVLIQHVRHEKINEALAQVTAEHLAELRVTKEAQEGLMAFLEKRKPVWNKNT